MLVELLDEDRPPAAPPPRGVAELGEQGPKVQQAQGFAGEVGIGTVVGRQVRLDVSTV